MASSKQNSLYPEIDNTNPEKPNSSTSSSTSPSIYPTVDVSDLAEKLFPEAAAPPHEDLLIRIPGAIVHLIEKDRSVELACGDLDISHYFFTLRVPSGSQEFDDEELLLNYGVTFASKGQEALLKRFDEVLESFSAFTVQEVANDKIEGSEMIDGTVARETTPEEFSKGGKKKELMKESSAAYWTVIAPNVEDYSSSLARMIAAGSGHVIKGILWCGDVTADRLKWGNDFFLRKLKKGEAVAVRPGTLRRIKRVKKLTKMSENVALGILTGVVKVSGFFTSPIVNSKVGKKFFSLLPGEIVLASLDGFNKICDAVEVAGKNVMSTSSVVTTGLVSHKYGEQAGKATNDGFDAAGHAIGTAWAVFKIRKALNPKSSFKPSSLAKAAAKASAKELKSKSMK
ncbi:Protein EARLY-RESPONSIVE TO DEHYDRATION 7, chloroplastic [Linum perenne]